jgi:hypothetical protein
MKIQRNSLHLLNRRACLARLGSASLGVGSALSLWPHLANAQEATTPRLLPLNRFPRMVQEHFVAEVRAAEQRGLAGKIALKTKADAEGYVRQVKAKIRQCFGPEPERTPLNAKVTGIVERDTYNIEKVISRPIFMFPKGARARCRASSAVAATRPTAKPPGLTSRSPRGWPGRATSC